MIIGTPSSWKYRLCCSAIIAGSLGSEPTTPNASRSKYFRILGCRRIIAAKVVLPIPPCHSARRNKQVHQFRLN